MIIVGGSYFELCENPIEEQFFGSGLRGAIALSANIPGISFTTCVGTGDKLLLESLTETFGINTNIFESKTSIGFVYKYPLAKPVYSFNENIDEVVEIPTIQADVILYYGMLEATPAVNGEFVIYDPQNYVSFKKTKSKAKNLALILNKKEANLLSGSDVNKPLSTIGKALMISQGASVVVIKDGSSGAYLFFNNEEHHIPVFETSTVWPIGSGDIFSAVFAWKWGVEKQSPIISATEASKFTALYCSTRTLPLPNSVTSLKVLPAKQSTKRIYLAGPYYSIEERWLVNEIKSILTDFGAKVFSPFHDVLSDDPEEIYKQDIQGLTDSDSIFAILNRMDPGTLFEIGYAKSLNKQVVVFSETISRNDLTMLNGCIICKDISTAIYKTTW